MFDALESVFGHVAVQVLGTIVIAITVQVIVRHTIKRVIHRAVRPSRYSNKSDEEKREKTLVSIFRTATAVLIWVTALAVVLWQLHINVAAALTGAGVLGVIVGFGAQNTVRDFLAGMFIIAENQYRVGDIVTLYAGGQEISGVVEELSVRITRLRDLDGNLHIVQNGVTSAVTNRSFEYANVNIDLGVSYDSDIDKVEKVMNDVGDSMMDDDEWSPHIIEPVHFLRLDSFGDSAVNVKALGKVEAAKQWDVAGEYRRRIKASFEKNHITIPLPQIVVHRDK